MGYRVGWSIGDQKTTVAVMELATARRKLYSESNESSGHKLLGHIVHALCVSWTIRGCCIFEMTAFLVRHVL